MIQLSKSFILSSFVAISLISGYTPVHAGTSMFIPNQELKPTPTLEIEIHERPQAKPLKFKQTKKAKQTDSFDIIG